MEGDTTRLRGSAAGWSLAGDSQLLDMLQNLHQTIVSKCQETNSQLESMMTALDNASIDLQNVNNKFLGLSNSQFVESRVYDDHTEITADDNNKDLPKPLSPRSSVRLALRTLESLHEPVPLLDSDSDEENSARVVLRPIIRRPTHTQEVSSSESDSEESLKRETQSVEEYSDSEPEVTYTHEHTPCSSVTSQARVDEQLTRQPVIPAPELQESPKTRKLYTVEKPITAQIFPEEPPPLDKFESDSEDDIFADLHKHADRHTHAQERRVADDLFGHDDGDVWSEPVAREQSPLFTQPVAPELTTPVPETSNEGNVKKPIGGISLFGARGPESIGAAILKRNQRQSSPDSDVTDAQTNKTNIIDDLFVKPAKNNKKGPVNVKKVAATDVAKDKVASEKIDLFSDIFDDVDDIFTSDVITKTTDNKKSIFDDDLFDADNDLFNDKPGPEKKTVKVEAEGKVRSIFDSDNEDDLFSDIKVKDKELKPRNDPVNNITVQVGVSDQLSPNVFDDDDDELFSAASKEYSVTKSGTVKHDDIFGEETEDNLKGDIKNDEIKVTDGTNDFSVNRDVNETSVTKIDAINPKVDDFDFDYSETKQVIRQPDDETNKNEIKDNPKLPEIDFVLETEDKIEETKDVQDVKSNDIFVDIFSDLPPAFERPNEPKKSKNVNALFDDDSDDEALFFKKDDVISDEKPEMENGNDRFRIFHDEPPDIDVDFSQKSITTEEIPDILDKVTAYEENSIDTEKEWTKIDDIRVDGNTRDLTNKDDNSEYKEEPISNVPKKEKEEKIDILKLLESERDDDIFKDDKVILSDAENDDSNAITRIDTSEISTKDSDSSESEKRPVGKLKPMNLNINVNTLLPGAVPKKTTSNEETDGQMTSKSNDDISVDDQKEVRAVTFKGEQDSGVLDNKLSKERAKIQVKRRPSTRRARLEAVRKSGLDFGSDSTDNSSSFDEPVRAKPRTNIPYKQMKTNETRPSTENKGVTSKVVYILNDEDIFDIPPITSETKHEDAFKEINTLGNTYKERKDTDVQKPLFQETKEKEVKQKSSLFEDMSDDDTMLFKKPTKKTIFDSDSDTELFGKDKRKENESKQQKKKETKQQKKEEPKQQKDKERKVDEAKRVSLFGDDSDDELFGANPKTYDVKATSNPKPSPKTSQTFNDPLSMLGDDAHI